MTVEEIVKREGLESLKEQFQELISNTVDNDEIEFNLHYAGGLLRFAITFPDGDKKHIIMPMLPYDVEFDDFDYIEEMFNYLVEQASKLYNDYQKNREDLDSHQINYCKKMCNIN